MNYKELMNYNQLMNYNGYNNEQYIIFMPQHKHTLPCPHYQLELCPIGSPAGLAQGTPSLAPAAPHSTEQHDNHTVIMCIKVALVIFTQNSD